MYGVHCSDIGARNQLQSRISLLGIPVSGSPTRQGTTASSTTKTIKSTLKHIRTTNHEVSWTSNKQLHELRS